MHDSTVRGVYRIRRWSRRHLVRPMSSEAFDHSHVPARTVLSAAGVTLIAAGVEVTSAWHGRSLFLAADAVHLLAHLAIFGILLTPARPGHERREDVITILVLSLILLIAGGIIGTSIRALVRSATEPPEPLLMMLALLGLGANVTTAYLFEKPAQHHWSFRAALAHELSDGALTVAGLAGALAIWFFGLRWMDPGLSLLIGLWLGLWTVRLLLRRVRLGRRVWALSP